MTAVTTRLVAEGDVATQSASVRQWQDHLLLPIVDGRWADEPAHRAGVTA